MIVNIIMVSEIMFGELHDGNNGSKNPHWRRRRKKRRERRGEKSGAVGGRGTDEKEEGKKREEKERFSMVTKI